MTVATSASEYYLRFVWPFYIGDNPSAAIAQVTDPCNLEALTWNLEGMFISEIPHDQ